MHVSVDQARQNGMAGDIVNNGVRPDEFQPAFIRADIYDPAVADRNGLGSRIVRIESVDATTGEKELGRLRGERRLRAKEPAQKR
jgi:hypothetical protein